MTRDPSGSPMAVSLSDQGWTGLLKGLRKNNKVVKREKNLKHSPDSLRFSQGGLNSEGKNANLPFDHSI